MPHSLRAKLGGLKYKGIITDKDYQRLCKALDTEKAIDDIKAEIEQNVWDTQEVDGEHDNRKVVDWSDVLAIIDKHISGK